MRVRDPKPEVLRLEELVKEVRFGGIRLPKFQRPFVWNKADMLNLLDSIYNGYPIGSILLWNSSERLKSERSIFDFDVDADASDVYPTDYLLDGQQRLTTLCGALYWSGSDLNSLWNIHFDLEAEKFVYPSKHDSASLFPLNKLLGTSDFIRECMKFEHQPSAKLYYRNAEKLLESIKNYKIAVVKIGDVSLEEIAPIFERINSTGRKLTMVDLMRAATWKGQFDLGDTIDSISTKARENGFGEIEDTSILRSIAAAADFGINKADIDKLRSLSGPQLTDAARSAANALDAALTFFREQIGMPDLSYLPYGLQLTHLAEFFRISPKPNEQTVGMLKQWFWITSVTRYFTGSNTGQNSKDLEEMRRFAKLSIVKPDRLEFNAEQNFDIRDFLFDEFNLRTASSTTYSLLLAQCRPHKSLFGQQIPAEGLPSLARDQFLDLLPEGSEHHNTNIGQVFNPLRHRKQKGALPSDVNLLELMLNEEALASLEAGDIGGFIQERRRLVVATLTRLTGGAVSFS
jgi:hypothetical protein